MLTSLSYVFYILVGLFYIILAVLFIGYALHLIKVLRTNNLKKIIKSLRTIIKIFFIYYSITIFFHIVAMLFEAIFLGVFLSLLYIIGTIVIYILFLKIYHFVIALLNKSLNGTFYSEESVIMLQTISMYSIYAFIGIQITSVINHLLLFNLQIKLFIKIAASKAIAFLFNELEELLHQTINLKLGGNLSIGTSQGYMTSNNGAMIFGIMFPLVLGVVTYILKLIIIHTLQDTKENTI